MTFRPYIFIFLFVAAWLTTNSALAQPGDNGVKKSKKTEVIGGKKYYIHKVEKGQTLYAIAKAYELAVNDIILENPGAIDGIKPGQELKIPFSKPTTTTTTTNTSGKDTTAYFLHKVEVGQTLFAISKMYGTTVEALEKLNPEAKNGLKPGQDLKIPGARRSPVLTTTVTAQPDTTHRKDTTVFHENKKNVYNVALFLPFALWKVEDINPDKIIVHQETFPEKPKLAAQFYEGVLLALDTLKKQGININLHVYESDEGDSAVIINTLKKAEFANMDLIIGPLYPGPFQRVAKFAAEKNICAISPVSQANRVLFGNADAVKTTPSITTQMEQLSSYVIAHHKGKRVIVVESGSPKDIAYVNAFRKVYDEERHVTGTKDTVPVTHGTGGVSALLAAGDTTILIVPSTSQTFVTDLARNLNVIADKDKNKLMVYGTAAWINYENIDFEYLQTLQLHFPTPYFIDYDAPATKQFQQKYLSTYKGDPNMYVFMGYDITKFFCEGLNQYGSGFYAKLPEMHGTGLQQTFEFYKTDAGSGYENRGVHIVKMVDYKLVKAQ